MLKQNFSVKERICCVSKAWAWCSMLAMSRSWVQFSGNAWTDKMCNASNASKNLLANALCVHINLSTHIHLAKIYGGCVFIAFTLLLYQSHRWKGEGKKEKMKGVWKRVGGFCSFTITAPLLPFSAPPDYAVAEGVEHIIACMVLRLSMICSLYCKFCPWIHRMWSENLNVLATKCLKLMKIFMHYNLGLCLVIFLMFKKVISYSNQICIIWSNLLV